jgi:hypothetical protein
MAAPIRSRNSIKDGKPVANGKDELDECMESLGITEESAAQQRDTDLDSKI